MAVRAKNAPGKIRGSPSEGGAECEWAIPVAAEAVQLPPEAATGMAVGSQVVQPQPTAIVTLGVGTKVHGGHKFSV